MEEKERKKIYFRRKKFLAVILTAMIFAFSGMNLYTYGEKYLADIERICINVAEGRNTLTRAVEKLEESLTGDMYAKMNLIEVFSYTNVLLDKREINNFEYIKDENGSLHYAQFYKEHDTEIFEYAMRINRLKDYVSENGTNVMFVVAPSKFLLSSDTLRMGLPINNPQENVNELLFYLNRLGIDTLDLNNYIPNGTVTYEDSFYRTDHHWSVDAAYYSSQILADRLTADYGLDMDTDTYLSDDAYTRVTYKDGMLGSMGRDTGICFSGLDDFTAYYPNFRMNFYRYCIEDYDIKYEFEGDITETLYSLDQLCSSEDIYEVSQYGIYLNELEVYEHIVNRENPNGPKILFIRDSYFSPVITFLAPMCSEIDAVWNMDKSKHVDIDEIISENTYDVIILEYYPYNIEDSGFSFFKGTE